MGGNTGADYDSSSAASLAIDGNASTFNHTTCTADKNWWQVKLPNPTLISKLVVTSRSSWTSRINGAGVYVSNTPYNGTLNESDKVATLNGIATAQTTAFSTPKSGAYVIVKAAADNCLHMSEVEVHGNAPASPHLDQSAYTFQLSNSAAIGKTVSTLKAVDYQLDSVSYALEGSSIPFAIDAQGKITVKTALQAGVTYTFDVVVSDGANVSRAPITVNVTASSSVEDALRTGDASVATSEELLDATIAALASQKATPSLLTALYGSDSIAYTPGNRTQLINFKPWVDSVFPIVVGNKGNTLAVAGTTPTARYAAFGISPMELFQANKSLTFETPFSRLLAWLLAGEPVNTNALSGNRKIALSFVSSEHTEIKAWIAKKYPSWTVTDCNTVATLATCYGSADLVVTGWQGNNADAQTIRQALATVMTAGKPVLYLHTWYEDYNDVAHAIADLLKFSLPYGGNFWANDAANWTNVTAMQTATWEKQGLAGVETMLKHFKANDYSIATRNTAFYPGANKVRAIMTLLDESKINLFQSNESRLYRLLALLGDSYRQEVVFPMDMDATNANVFLKSLFADHAVYNYRTLNRVQADMGNFSRSDFSHITPVTKTVTMTSRQNFRAAGVYALPGKTVRVTRNDNSSTTTKVFINSLRSGSTHEYEAWGYKRPKFLESAHVPIKSGETITLTSPYGGPIQIDFGINDQPVSFTFEQVGEHPFWDDTSDNAVFSAKLAAGEYDWAEFVTPAFEIHSTLEKMRESVSNTRWGGTLEGFAAATMRYIHNFPHVLAGFKGPNIDVVPEIHDFATANGFTIENLDLVKHMNADQATCGYGCSGNPYDAYWAFDPIGHGDIHEMGHGLEKSRFRLEGWNYHASTNPYSYYSKTQYYKTTGGDSDCQSLPFKDAFVALQASVGQANPAAYLKTNYWDAVEDNWSRAASMTIQMMMTAEHQGALVDGWHLLARLHILEREFNRARSDTTAWDAKKTSLGFASYSKAEADAISNNDWMVIAVSKVTGMDYRDYFSMWGQAFSAKANAQVVAFNHAAAQRRFFITSPSGYCKGEGFDGNFLPVTGSQVWPLAGAQPRLMGDSFR
ncbi:ImpA family metalloprotease [Thiothrix subterranea]|uniref:ImpA family metalloprotease n=1 Tax=Thiothrix subterranea TaxID=2735563 RepID=UPI00280ABF4A|nr:ImpA family metalloprotease [Thiothrix subterranea]